MAAYDESLTQKEAENLIREGVAGVMAEFEQLRAEEQRKAQAFEQQNQAAAALVAAKREALKAFDYRRASAFEFLDDHEQVQLARWGPAHVVVGLFGQTGSGKSSLVATMERALRNTFMSVLTGHSAAGEGTLIMMDYFLDMPFRVMDTRGFSAWDHLERTEIANILLGRLTAGEMPDRVQAVMAPAFEQLYTRETLLQTNASALVHVMLIVVDATDARLNPGAAGTRTTYARYFEPMNMALRSQDLRRIVVLTHADQLPVAALQERITLASAAFSCPLDNIHTISNYTRNFTQPNYAAELTALKILEQALHLGTAFIETWFTRKCADLQREQR